MCGIAGIVNLTEPTAVDPHIVRRMADAITHRGPDEDGYFFRPGLGMANRRLCIVGLADGQQPITNEDRAISVVFNGELFDYPELKAELQSKSGHQFRTHCDTELLPHLWEDHGEGMLRKAARPIRLRPLGRTPTTAVPGPRSLRHLSAVLDRRQRRFAAVRVGDQGPARVRDWCPPGPIRAASITSSPSSPRRAGDLLRGHQLLAARDGT